MCRSLLAGDPIRGAIASKLAPALSNATADQPFDKLTVPSAVQGELRRSSAEKRRQWEIGDWETGRSAEFLGASAPAVCHVLSDKLRVASFEAAKALSLIT